jgi:hypothetical protein
VSRSRAGRTGGSWYGSYVVVYRVDGREYRHDATNRRRAEGTARELVRRRRAEWAEVRDNRGGVLYRLEAP